MSFLPLKHSLSKFRHSVCYGFLFSGLLGVIALPSTYADYIQYQYNPDKSKAFADCPKLKPQMQPLFYDPSTHTFKYLQQYLQPYMSGSNKFSGVIPEKAKFIIGVENADDPQKMVATSINLQTQNNYFYCVDGRYEFDAVKSN